MSVATGIKGFSYSIGWHVHFKERYSIHSFALHGEAALVDEACAMLGRLRLHEILASYTDDEIYNTDQTGLFLRLEPAHTLGTAARAGIKKSKEWITLSFLVNASGSDQAEACDYWQNSMTKVLWKDF